MLDLDNLLTPRWAKLDFHKEQYRLRKEKRRFKCCAAGRRSGKTEIAKRKIVKDAAGFTKAENGRFICAAPTRTQAKDIYWRDLKSLVPRYWLADWMPKPISESELTINLCNGARLEVRGMDAPERVEGDPIDGIILDEYANMKKGVWTNHVRPGLTTKGRPLGWAWLIGVPEGRNHYYETCERAKHLEDWDFYSWFSSDILPPEEIAAAREELDELTFKQEYEADFVTFAGRAYYSYDPNLHVEKLHDYYNDRDDLYFCFDFNVEPGICGIVQEMEYLGVNGACSEIITACFDEVYIPTNSTTPRVCEQLVKKYGNHKGKVVCFGDPAGGARGTAKVAGSDWEIIKDILGKVFGNRLSFEVTKAAPSERSRVNAVNSRLKSSTGVVRMLIDPIKAKHTSVDFDTVQTDSEGYIDKRTNKMLTHLSDGIGYYIHRRFPINRGERLSVRSI